MNIYSVVFAVLFSYNLILYPAHLSGLLRVFERYEP
jgi:hypothetical protein